MQLEEVVLQGFNPLQVLSKVLYNVSIIILLCQFQSLIGSIKSGSEVSEKKFVIEVSIPYRFYQKTVTSTMKAFNLPCFNPLQVLSKDAVIDKINKSDTKFQSLIGSIKSGKMKIHFMALSQVSIPYRFYQKLSQHIDRKLYITVSIPYRFYQKLSRLLDCFSPQQFQSLIGSIKSFDTATIPTIRDSFNPLQVLSKVIVELNGIGYPVLFQSLIGSIKRITIIYAIFYLYFVSIPYRFYQKWQI